MRKILHTTIITGILILFGATTFHGNAQIYTGGGVGVHMEDGRYYLDASPIIGYRYKMVDAGVSPFFAYREYKDRADAYSFGNRIFFQLSFQYGFFGHAEFEVSNVEAAHLTPEGKRARKWILGMPVGAGYRYTIAPNTEAYGMILYDVLLDQDNPRKNPSIRGGVVYKL